MHHVSVAVGVNDGVVGVFHGDLLVTLPRSGTCWPTRLGPGNAGLARTRQARVGPTVGTSARYGPWHLSSGDDLGSNWSGRGTGQAGVVDRECEPASRASAAWTISATSAGVMVVPSRSKPKGRGPPALYCPEATRRAVSRDALVATAHMTRAGVMSASLASRSDPLTDSTGIRGEDCPAQVDQVLQIPRVPHRPAQIQGDQPVRPPVRPSAPAPGGTPAARSAARPGRPAA